MHSAGTSIELVERALAHLGDDYSLLIGKVSTVIDRQADFTVHALLPPRLQDLKDFPMDESKTHLFNVRWTSDNEDNKHKMEAIHKASYAVGELAPKDGLDSSGGKHCLRNIVSDMKIEYKSYDLIEVWKISHPNDKLHDTMTDAIQTGRLTAQQQHFIISTLRGAPGATILLEGNPGTGKTAALSCMVGYLLRMEYKVLIVGQSNYAVDALFEGVLEFLHTKKPTPTQMINGCVRLRREEHEDAQAHLIETGVTKGDVGAPKNLSAIAVANHLMSMCIDRWIKANPKAEMVCDYEQHRSHRRGGANPQSNHSWSKVISVMRSKILESAKLVGCTASVASNPDLEAFKPDVVIFDEAGQATDPDLLMALMPHLKVLLLLVLGGDTRQLGPVVQSNATQQNPLSAILSTPVMERIKFQRPEITTHKLTVNFRGHPSTMAMSSHLFYSGEMTPGGDIGRWDTDLSRGVKKILHSDAFKYAYLNKNEALSNDNRQFSFDVQGYPQQDHCGTSWWNPLGVTAIVSFANTLVSRGKVAVTEIGIISMYAEDVRRIRDRLEVNGLSHIQTVQADDTEIATVDAFQGREKKIILVHFVAALSTSEDRKHPLASFARKSD